MLRTISLLRPTARLALFLPMTILAAACGGDDAGTPVTGADAGDGASRGGDAGQLSDAANDGDPGADGAVAVPDTTPPTVISTDPVDLATGEGRSGPVSATFSEAMDPLTLTDATFSVKNGATAVLGVVSAADDTVIFTPSSELALGTTYTATVTTGAKDLAQNALAAPHSWSFTTAAVAPVGPAPVNLGTAGRYVILAKSAITNVPTSAVTGDLGLSPAAASYITGFAMTKAGTKWTSKQVTGSIFAADNVPPTPSNLTTAVANMQTAYTDAAGRPTPTFLNLGAGAIGGLTLVPGLYKWTSTVTIPTDVKLAGGANDTWIFQVTGDLKMSAAKQMTLSGGARAKNIVWQVAGLVDLGTTSHAEGIILSKTAITLGTGASINGRLLAQTAVNIAGSTVKTPAP